jgi:pathogenesis-related protein 1
MVATGTSIDETIQGFLVPQNEARRQVGVPPLKWDVKLTNYARTYARERRADCLLQHSDGPFGENIFWGSGRGWNATEAVGAWVDEKKWYNYANNSCSSGKDCTHYTQIVWRTTTKVGCAVVKCNSGDTFITCNYYPPGNYIGARPYRDLRLTIYHSFSLNNATQIFDSVISCAQIVRSTKMDTGKQEISYSSSSKFRWWFYVQEIGIGPIFLHQAISEVFLYP